MRYSFGHARATRQRAENVLVRAELADGTLGWGEGIPREYVTGETLGSAFACLQQAGIGEVLPPTEASFAEAVLWLWSRPLADQLGRDRLANAAACALETALLDAYARREGRPCYAALELLDEAQLLRRIPAATQVRQTLTIADDIEAALARAGQPARDIAVKLKVGFGLERDVARATQVRAALGDDVDLRLDANGAWSLPLAKESLQALTPFRPTSIEEPLPQRAFDAMAELRRATCVPLMLDESLCTMADARRAQEANAADFYNLRLSKCGGILPTLRLALEAHRAGIGYQLGCMVGETGILSALGRGFAGHVDGVRYLESTVPARSLERDITDGNLETEPCNRWTQVPRGVGIGVNVEDAIVDTYVIDRADIEA
jgi:muconate cycloisomerase